MGDLLQQILLSDFAVFGLVALVLILITTWARNLREWAGYALGWLVGIFFILMLLTLLPPPPPPDPALPPVVAQFTFWELIVPSFFGLIIGFGLLFAVRLSTATDSRIRRALTVAALLSFTLVTAYLALRASIPDRMGLAFFILAFAIGALLNFILTRSLARSTINRAL